MIQLASGRMIEERAFSILRLLYSIQVDDISLVESLPSSEAPPCLVP